MTAIRPREAGYSLLEVLIALAIMALATMFALPGLSAGLSAASRHTATLDIRQQISALRAAALREDVTYAILGSEERLIATSANDPQGVSQARPPAPDRRALGPAAFAVRDVVAAKLSAPRGWTYASDDAVLLRADGTCSGGVIDLRRGLERLRFSIDPATCAVYRS